MPPGRSCGGFGLLLGFDAAGALQGQQEMPAALNNGFLDSPIIIATIGNEHDVRGAMLPQIGVQFQQSIR